MNILARLLPCLLSLILLASPLLALTPEEAAKAVGQQISLTGLVSSARKTNVGALYLNFGAAYPDQIFTVFIAKKDAAAFPEASTYQGKVVTLSGVVTLHNDKPQIQLHTPDQIIIAADDTAPAPAAAASATPAASPVATP